MPETGAQLPTYFSPADEESVLSQETLPDSTRHYKTPTEVISFAIRTPAASTASFPYDYKITTSPK